MPNTPAGVQFSGWLSAFQSGHEETIRQFATDHLKNKASVQEMVDTDLSLCRNDGSYELRRITESSPYAISALLQSKDTGYWLQVRITVGQQTPNLLETFSYHHTEIPIDLLPSVKLSDEEIARRTDTLISWLTGKDAFSGVILVARDGKPIYERAVGYASRTWRIKNRIDTKFNVASIGKMFTAVAIAKLAEQGKLSFEDTVGKFLPDYPNSDVAKKVTVNQLLTHTSGLESHSLSALSRGYRTLKEYLPTFDQFSPKFEPGTRYEYSNDGYLLLGLIIEKVSGESFYDYVRKNIYLSAGMKSTDCYELDADTENLATGYMDGPNNSRRDNIFALPIKGLPYGLGYSTVGDLLKFDTALRNHSILSAQSTKELWEGKVQEGDQRTQYGYGFDIADFNGTRYVGHSGGWAGITDQMDMYLDSGYTVVILTNYDDSPRGIAFKLREWLTQGLRE